MSYVDGFVLPVPKKKLAAYRRHSRIASKVFREHGALQFVESVGDDLDVKFGLPFPRAVKPKPGETIVFSWILYRSRAQRDRANAKAMADPRMQLEMGALPFDVKRMSCGGFKVLVEA